MSICLNAIYQELILSTSTRYERLDPTSKMHYKLFSTKKNTEAVKYILSSISVAS